MPRTKKTAEEPKTKEIVTVEEVKEEINGEATETGSTSPQEGLGFYKHLNGKVTIIGEVEKSAEEDTDTEEAEESAPKKRTRRTKKAEAEEAKEDAPIDMEQMFEKRRTNMEKKKTRSKVKIVAVDGVEVETEESRLREELDTLMRAARAIPPTRLKGRVVSFRKTPNQGDYIMELRTLDEKGKASGQIPVFIPADQFFVYNAADYAGEKGEEHFENELKSRLNSEVEFCVYNVFEKEKTAYASRLKALESKAYMYYKKQQTNGKPKIEQGALVPAVVTSVRIDRVKVDVAGAECTIRSGEMSWLAQRDLRAEYKVGDTFLVKVISIEPADYKSCGQTYHLYKIEVSKRMAEENPAEKYFDRFHIGEICSGEVKVDNSEIGVFVKVKDLMDCLCPHPAAGTPEPGTEVSVVITSMNAEEKRLYGFIKGV